MNLSIQKDKLRIGYYAGLTVLIFTLMNPGVMLPSILRIALLILIFFPVLLKKDDFPFVFIAFYGISTISFTPILPTSDFYYIVIVLLFYLLSRKKKQFIFNSLPIYGYFLIVSLIHFDYTSSITWILIAILICDMIEKEESLNKLFYSFIIISVFLSILFIVHREEFMVQYSVDGTSDVERSGWTNPNGFGATIAIGGILSVAYLTNTIIFTKSLFKTIVCIITLILTTIVLILNASRGALLAYAVPSVIMLLFSKIKLLHKLIIIVFIILFIGWIYTNNMFELLFVRIADENTATGGGRTEIWQLKIEHFLMKANILNLLFGIGETETVILGRYISTHNDIVTSFVAYGMVGLLLFVYFIFIYPIIKSNKKNRFGVIAMLLYIFIECNVVEPFFRGSIVIVMFYFFILKYGSIINIENVKK